MNYKTRVMMLSIGFTIFVALSYTILPAAAFTELSAYESASNSPWLVSKAEAQGQVVFVNQPGGGAMTYYLWTQAEAVSAWPWADQQIQIDIYYQVYYKQENKYGVISYYWGAPPKDLIIWDGTYDYGLDCPASVQWRVGGSWFGFSVSVIENGDPTGSYSRDTSQTISNDYRHMGWFRSCTGGWQPAQKMTAMLNLKLSNGLAYSYYNGYTNPSNEITKWVIDFRFKLIFKNLNEPSYTHTLILGDGVGGFDLTHIPLTPQ